MTALALDKNVTLVNPSSVVDQDRHGRAGACAFRAGVVAAADPTDVGRSRAQLAASEILDSIDFEKPLQ